MNSWPRSEASRATVKFWEQSFSRRHYPLKYQHAEKGVYLFYKPPNNFSRRTHVDRSCIFCGFFCVFSVRNCQPAFYLSVFFIYPSLAFSAKSLFRFSLTDLKLFQFYNPPNNFSRRTLVDRSCIFWGFFRVSRYGIVNRLFIYPSTLASSKCFFWFSLTNSKFSVNVCSFLGFSSVEIKSDDGHQIGRGISSDNHRPILYMPTWSVLSNESPQKLFGGL